MNDIIFKHRTIRKYKSQNIEPAVLENILEAGTKASTTGNMQVYSIIVTKDKELRKKLWSFHFKQDMVLEAPVLLTFCADFNRFNKWCENRKAVPCYDNYLSFYTASIDALLVAQNVALAAESFGLGICYLGTTIYMTRDIIDALDIPKNVVPVTTLVIGYPDEEPGLTDRLPLKGVVHEEKYKDYNSDDINKIYAEKEALPFTKELLEINKTETLAQVFTQYRYIKKDNIHFSQKFLEVIKNQGFMNNE